MILQKRDERNQVLDESDDSPFHVTKVLPVKMKSSKTSPMKDFSSLVSSKDRMLPDNFLDTSARNVLLSAVPHGPPLSKTGKNLSSDWNQNERPHKHFAAYKLNRVCQFSFPLAVCVFLVAHIVEIYFPGEM